MVSSVTLHCQVIAIVMIGNSQLSEIFKYQHFPLICLVRPCFFITLIKCLWAAGNWKMRNICNKNYKCSKIVNKWCMRGGLLLRPLILRYNTFQLPTCAHLFLSNLWILLVISDRFNKTQLKQYKAPLNSYGNVHGVWTNAVCTISWIGSLERTNLQNIQLEGDALVNRNWKHFNEVNFREIWRYHLG